MAYITVIGIVFKKLVVKGNQEQLLEGVQNCFKLQKTTSTLTR
jgi:hypothetical protein